MGNYSGGVKVGRRPVVCSKIPTPQYYSLGTLGARWRLDQEQVFREGRQAGYQLKDSTCSVARIHLLGSPKALGQCDVE